MDNLVIKKNKSLKCGSAIKILSIIALVCTVLSCISYFFYYTSEGIDGEWVMTFRFPDFVSLISLLLAIAPAALFVLYIFKFYNKLKATILVPIIFGLFALEFLESSLKFLIIAYEDFHAITVIFFRYYGISLLVFVACILALINALKGFNKKGFIIIAMSVCLLYEAESLIRFFSSMYNYIEFSRYLYLFIWPMSIVGQSSLYIALLLFGLKNKIPSVISLLPEREKARAEKMNPEQALKLLKDKLDLDMITEEEYQAQRTEIISKL